MVAANDIEAAASARGRNVAIGLLLLAVIAAAYANALDNDEFVSIESRSRVRDNSDLYPDAPLWRAAALHLLGDEAAENAGTLVRRPLLSLSFAANFALLGAEASDFRVVNVAIHMAAALLLLAIVRRTLSLCGYPGGRAQSLSFAIAALWACHPVQTESVTNIVQRAESLMGLLALLSFYAGVRHATQPPHRRSRRWAIVSVLALAAGLGVKEIIIVLPVLFWLYDVVFLCDGAWREPWRRRRHLYLAYLATWAIPAVLLALTLEDARSDVNPERLRWYVASQPRVLLHYLRVSLFPEPHFHHVPSGRFWLGPHGDPWSLHVAGWLLIGMVSAATVAGLVLGSRASFCGAAFLLPLLPTSLMATRTLAQDHRLYLSLAALAALSVLSAAGIAERVRPRFAGTTRGLLVAALLAALMLLVSETRERNEEYRSWLTVYAPEDLPRAASFLVANAIVASNLTEAASVLEQLLATPVPDRAHRDDPNYLDGVRARNALGAVRLLEARLGEAAALFEAALAKDPSYASARNNLGVAYVRQGRLVAGAEQLETAARQAPDLAAAQFNLGISSFALGEREVAGRRMARAEELVPELRTVRAAAWEALSSGGRLRFLSVPSPRAAGDESLGDYRLILEVVAAAGRRQPG